MPVIILGLENLRAGLDALPVTLRDAERTATELAGQLVQTDAQGRAPRRSGQLIASIESMVDDTLHGYTVSVGTDISYGSFVEEGTAPHEIAPVAALALVTDVGVYARVQHPGTSPQPYLAPALEDNRDDILELYRASAQDALATIRGV